MLNQEKNKSKIQEKVQEGLRKAGSDGNEGEPAYIQRRAGVKKILKKVGAGAAVGAAVVGSYFVANNEIKSDAEAYKNSPSVDYVVSEGDTLYDIAGRFTNGDPRELSDQLTAEYGTKIFPGQSIRFHIGTNPSEYAEQVAHEQEHQRQLAQQESEQG